MKDRMIIQNSIIEDMSEGVMAIRFDGRIELVNDAALEILERSREELEGRSFAQCFFNAEHTQPETGSGAGGGQGSGSGAGSAQETGSGAGSAQETDSGASSGPETGSAAGSAQESDSAAGGVQESGSAEREEGENDAFTECVLDVIYSRSRRQERYVAYHTGHGTRQLRIVSSYLREQGEAAGVILVISDITELTRMRDAVRAMETIRELNTKLTLRNRVLQETFGRYLSDEVVREILDSPDGWKLGGQKRTLSILMSDLRGFTLLCERMKPQDLISMLNHYFSEMYEEISRYNGTLIEFLGDGMFVIFGAPVSSGTHASDAVAAAIGMQNRMEKVNAWNVERGYAPLSMGIAVNTDAVILGNLGSERRTKYGVVGQAVNLAGRLQGYTAGGEVLISPSTRRAVTVPLQIGRTLTIAPKGVREKMEVSSVIRLGPPYDLVLEGGSGDREEDLRRLAEAVPVAYYVLEGKKVGDLLRRGRITAISDRTAILEPDLPEPDSPEPNPPETGLPEPDLSEAGSVPDLYDHLRLEVGDGLYAMVTQKEGDCCRIRFTGKPVQFDTWIRNIGK